MTVRIDRIKIIEQAERFVKADRLKEAIVEYERLAGTDPDDVGTLNTIGDLSIRLGQNDKAVRYFLRVAEEYEKRGLFTQALATFKKIYKISPDNAEFALRLGDLYANQGFLSDAKIEYNRIAERFIKEEKLQEAIHVLEKIIRLDREDLAPKKQLAALYQQIGFVDAAFEQLNEIAELLVARGDLAGAEEVLKEALALRPADPKSLVSLVDIYKRQNEVPKAIALIEEGLAAAPDNVQLLNLLGNIYFESGDTKKAEDLFTVIVSGHPMNVNARIKLGRIQILKDKLDDAFGLFEPLISSLIKKHKDEKAIGLLGLILEAQKPHLPALEMLASIYRVNKEEKKLEVVLRAVLDELRRQDAKDKLLPVYDELRQLRPEDADLMEEARMLRRELGLPEDERQEDATGLTDKDREAIQETLAQADLYMQQGLVRNARRILENVRFRYPDDHQIMRKIAVLDEIRTHIDEDELRRRVELATQMESKIKEKGPLEPQRGGRRPPTVTFGDDAAEGEKVSTADIFAETDIIPFLTGDGAEHKYYDLQEQIAGELKMMRLAYEKQAQGEISQDERDLSNIVADFKRDLRAKLIEDSCETHYQLGIAFMDQGLYGEAIEEFTAASKDKTLALDCFSLIGFCCRQRKNFVEAEKWLKSAILMAKPGSEQYYSLEFDLGELMEQTNERERALSIFREVQGWNPGYRNIAGKIEILEHT